MSDSIPTSKNARIDSALFFAKESPLSEHLPGFRYRVEQKDYAEAVSGALATKQPLFIEAGTGTGKTLGYLIPLLQSKQKVLISTGTKTLQDQLFHRDLPAILEALDRPIKIALLKGRSNYLCIYRLEKIRDQPNGLFPVDIPDLKRINDWAASTVSGEFSQSGVPEQSRLLQQINASSEHCLGRECPSYSDCYLVKARNKAQAADLVVVNHHLVCADLQLRESQQIEVIPSADVIVFDEAHQLPKVITDFFSDQASVRQLQRTLDDSKAAVFHDVAEAEHLLKSITQLSEYLKDYQRQVSPYYGRWSWSAIRQHEVINDAMLDLSSAWSVFTDELSLHSEASADVARCLERVRSIRGKLKRFLADNDSLNDEDTQSNAGILWVEVAARNSRWLYTPLNAGELFSARLKDLVQVPIFTSATLTTNGGFQHIKQALGLPNADERLIPSPFKLSTQVMRFDFTDLPEPSHPLYYDKVFAQLITLLDATDGRAFVLMTSHRDIERAAHYFDRNPLLQTVLYQGSQPKHELIDAFQSDGNAVLVATQSFWEGVDIKGAALSCVVIVKLPFAPPDDPVLQAKSERLRQQGGNPFMSLQLPESLILFKQGIGRLIRDESDRGILAIADPRVRTKRYGQYFIDIIKEAPATNDLDKIHQFLLTGDMPST